MRGAGSEPRRARPHPMEKGGAHMLPVMVYYLAVNAAAFALGAAWSRRSVRALSALARLMVIAGGTPGMLAARALRGRGLRETGPLALAHPLIWLALHIAVLAALMDRAGGGTGGWLAVLGRAPGLGLYLACTNAAAFLAFAIERRRRRWAVFASGRPRCWPWRWRAARRALWRPWTCAATRFAPRASPGACRSCWRRSARCWHGRARWDGRETESAKAQRAAKVPRTGNRPPKEAKALLSGAGSFCRLPARAAAASALGGPRRVRRRYSVTICQVVSNPWDTGSSGVTVPMWATYSPSCVGTGARSAPRYWLAVQQQSASVRPVASRKP